MEAAIDKAIDQHMDWSISKRDYREHGIPQGLPWLTGWVMHFVIQAERETEAIGNGARA